MINVLLVEDDAPTAQAVEQALDGQAQLRWTDNGLDGLRLAAEPADVIILDRMLPGVPGLEITRRLRAAGIATPILMLSALGRGNQRVEGLDVGADDYLAKPFEPAELVARVRALHRRAHRTSPAVIIHGELECHLKARTAHRAGRHLALSPKEFGLFRYLMENAGELVTRDMLLRHVWGLSFDPQTNVVDVNMGRLRRKLEDGFATPVLETVRGAGFRLLTGG